MKNLISFITLLVFLHTTTYHMISTEAKDELPDPVLDLDGDELLAGKTYFVRSAFKGMGGGVSVWLVLEPPQLVVVQQKSDTDLGLPQAFFPDGFKDGDVVRESTDMNIEIHFGVIDGFWKVEDDSSANQTFVVLVGTGENPGNVTASNWFKFEKVGIDNINVYKIVFCPSVCESCTCGDVGIYEENELNRLALSDVPFYVAFQKEHKVDHKKY